MSELVVIAYPGYGEYGVRWENYVVLADGRRYPCGGVWLNDDGSRTFFGVHEFAPTEADGLATLQLLHARGVIEAVPPAAECVPTDPFSPEVDAWQNAYDAAAAEAQRWASKQVELAA